MSLKSRRKALGWTQQELATRFGVKRETIARYETGARRMDSEKLIALSRLMECSVDDLLRPEFSESITRGEAV